MHDDVVELVCCDFCSNAYHEICLGVYASTLPDPWQCPDCVADMADIAEHEKKSMMISFKDDKVLNKRKTRRSGYHEKDEKMGASSSSSYPNSGRGRSRRQIKKPPKYKDESSSSDEEFNNIDSDDQLTIQPARKRAKRDNAAVTTTTTTMKKKSLGDDDKVKIIQPVKKRAKRGAAVSTTTMKKKKLPPQTKISSRGITHITSSGKFVSFALMFNRLLFATLLCHLSIIYHICLLLIYNLSKTHSKLRFSTLDTHDTLEHSIQKKMQQRHTN